jgi:hypothetical protein
LGLERDEADRLGQIDRSARNRFDAAYVALAEQESIRLVTDDLVILAVARSVSLPLVSVAEILPLEADSAGLVNADEPNAENADSG